MTTPCHQTIRASTSYVDATWASCPITRTSATCALVLYVELRWSPPTTTITHPHPSPLTKKGVDILLQIQDARGCMLVYQKQAKLDMQGSVFIVCRHRHERSPLRTDMVHPKLPRTCSCVTSVCKACCMMALYMPRVYIRRHPDNKLSQTWLCDMYDTLDSQPCHTHSLGSSLAQSST